MHPSWILETEQTERFLRFATLVVLRGKELKNYQKQLRNTILSLAANSQKGNIFSIVWLPPAVLRHIGEWTRVQNRVIGRSFDFAQDVIG